MWKERQQLGKFAIGFCQANALIHDRFIFELLNIITVNTYRKALVTLIKNYFD
jgi:hypothetical protein